MIEVLQNKTALSISGCIILLIFTFALLNALIHNFMVALTIAALIGGVTLVALLIYAALQAHRERSLRIKLEQANLKKIEAEKWAIEQRVLTEQEQTQTKEQNHLQIELEKIRLEQMRAQLEHERLMVTAQYNASQVTLNAGQTLVRIDEQGEYQPYHAPARLEGPRKNDQSEETAELVKPTAPNFLDMCHLITTKQAPLCFDVNGPVYGTVLDLLSMAVSGKPGRGKTTALMYYVAFLLCCGAEVWIFDPHGTMGELAKLNGQRLSNMPATAKVVYLDRQEDMTTAIPTLMNELADRDELYRPAHEVKHPLLVLADELPVISEFDADIIQDWKNTDRDKRPAHPLTFARLFKKFVLEARKWQCFFIGSGQTFDAETLPKKITDNLNSRIVFFSSDQRARMSGLESDAIKNLLPAIRRAGPGSMILDCSRFDAPIMGAIPHITVDDLMQYLGVQTGTGQVVPGTLATSSFSPNFQASHNNATNVLTMPDLPKTDRITGPIGTRPEMDVETPVNGVPVVSGDRPRLKGDDKLMTPQQEVEFLKLYRKKGNIKDVFKLIDGVNNRHNTHASWLVEKHGLRGDK